MWFKFRGRRTVVFWYEINQKCFLHFIISLHSGNNLCKKLSFESLIGVEQGVENVSGSKFVNLTVLTLVYKSAP